MANRPKGYLTLSDKISRTEGTWCPSADVLSVIQQVRSILTEYASYGPMTVRQIFYRMVGQYGYAKDERAYKRLAEYLVKARRAQLIPFGRIRDDGTISHPGPQSFEREEVWDYIQDLIKDPGGYLHLDRNTDQPYHIELWCEAGGMAPMLAQMVRHRDVAVYSTGGFSSVTVTYEVAQRISRRDKPTYFLHIGDYDPSGESIFASMSQDIGSFIASTIGGYYNSLSGAVRDENKEDFFVPQRVALTEAQVEEFDLPTAPPKASDSRSANWLGETTQAEAMPPTLLEEVVREALDELTDDDAMAEIEKREEEEKEALRAAVDDQDVQSVIEEFGLADTSLLELVEVIRDKDLGRL